MKKKRNNKNNRGNYNTRSAQLRWRVPSGSGDMAPTRFIFLKKQIKNNTRFANFVSVAANNGGNYNTRSAGVAANNMILGRGYWHNS